MSFSSPAKWHQHLLPFSHLEGRDSICRFQNRWISSFELGRLLNFTYHTRIYFRSFSFLSKVIRHIQAVPIEEEAIRLGLEYREKIVLGSLLLVEVRWIESIMGFGLFAQEKMNRGEFIGEYVGEIVLHSALDYSDYYYRYPALDQSGIPFKIDARDGNIIRFVNHSKKFNACMHRAYVAPFYHQILIADRDIEIGEQILYDYGDRYWDTRCVPKVF